MTIRTTLIATGAATFALAATPAFAADYTIDDGHTQANFRVTHMSYSTMWGRFNEESGTISFDPANPGDASVNLVIDAASIDTNHGERDDHLRSPDFFNTAEFPEITFNSTSVEVTGENTAKITGDLTMLGVTKSVTLDAVYNGMGNYPWDDTTEVVGFDISGVVDRTEFGMMYGVGGIGTDIKIDIELEATRSLN
jgi:polyisoprenoid-binding protein YceI